jgi:hypothetical protein
MTRIKCIGPNAGHRLWDGKRASEAMAIVESCGFNLCQRVPKNQRAVKTITIREGRRSNTEGRVWNNERASQARARRK